MLRSLMAVLAYTTAFCALVWMNTGTFRFIKIYSEVPEDSAFILSKSRFDRCWHNWDTDVTVRQTDGFSALYNRSHENENQTFTESKSLEKTINSPMAKFSDALRKSIYACSHHTISKKINNWFSYSFFHLTIPLSLLITTNYTGIDSSAKRSIALTNAQ